MKYVILITMVFAAPYASDPVNTVKVDTYKNRPLRFDTIEQCDGHVYKHTDSLKEFALSAFKDKPNSVVKQIFCVEESSISS